MTDPGELFLQGYFGQAKLQQDRMAAASQAQQWQATMEFNKQKLAQESAQNQAEMALRNKEFSQRADTEARQARAQKFTEDLGIGKGVNEGIFEAAKPGPEIPGIIGGNVTAMQEDPNNITTPSGRTVRIVPPEEQAAKQAATARAARQTALSDMSDEFDTLDKANPRMFSPELKNKIKTYTMVEALHPGAYKQLFPEAKNLTPGEVWAKTIGEPMQNEMAQYTTNKYTNKKTGDVDWQGLFNDKTYKGMSAKFDAAFQRTLPTNLTVGAAQGNRRNDNKDYADYTAALKSQFDKMTPDQLKALKTADLGNITRQAKSQLYNSRAAAGQDLPDYRVLNSADTDALREISKEKGVDMLALLGGQSLTAPTPGH